MSKAVTDRKPWAFLDAHRGTDFKGEWPTLPEMFRITVKRFGNRPCFTVFEQEKHTLTYNEVLEKEFYLDTLYVFSKYRGEGVGNKLLTSFVNSSNTLLSLNVAQSNVRARKLYESYGFYKNCEIYIGHENYDHLIKTK